MEDNLTKAKRALMAPKQLCPSGLNIQSIKRKVQTGERNESILTKLREMMIRKSREYRMSFPKYRRDLKQGQAWCGNICHAIDYKVETITAEDVNFAIYGAIETNPENYSTSPGTWNNMIQQFYSSRLPRRDVGEGHECKDKWRGEARV